MTEVQAPNLITNPGPFTLFLAGTIEMGRSTNWQKNVIEMLSDVEGTVFNPRRDDWDSNWKQSISDPDFTRQVEWELRHIWASQWVFFYFEPGSMSPISLLELGICTRKRSSTVVCCPEGYGRKGNVDITCRTFGIPVYEHLPLAIDYLKSGQTWQGR